MTVLKVLKEGDEALLLSAAEGVFDTPVRETSAKEFLEDRRHHIGVAIDEEPLLDLHREFITFTQTNPQNCGSVKCRLRQRIAGGDWVRPF